MNVSEDPQSRRDKMGNQDLLDLNKMIAPKKGRHPILTYGSSQEVTS